MQHGPGGCLAFGNQMWSFQGSSMREAEEKCTKEATHSCLKSLAEEIVFREDDKPVRFSPRLRSKSSYSASNNAIRIPLSLSGRPFDLRSFPAIARFRRLQNLWRRRKCLRSG